LAFERIPPSPFEVPVSRPEASVLLTCWSAKGGSGTTVVAVALSLLVARRSTSPAFLVDVAGDAAAALGVHDPGPGLGDWLAAGPEVPATALARLGIEVAPNLSLIPAGEFVTTDPATHSRGVARLIEALTAMQSDDAPVIVDAGVPRRGDGDIAAAAIGAATTSLLVLRPCYLGLRRALASPHRPTAVVLVDENERALDVADIEDALGTPVVAVVPNRPEIARAVDAGLLAGRLPRALASSLRRAA
jgi:cellulose biosynthesis protein BcsQ